MDQAVTALDILFFLLMAAIALPFLLLVALLIAAYFDLAIADALAGAVAVSLKVTWIIGCVVNFAGGLALVALGIWLPMHAPTVTHWVIGTLAIIPLGVWRTWRGFAAFPRREDRV